MKTVFFALLASALLIAGCTSSTPQQTTNNTQTQTGTPSAQAQLCTSSTGSSMNLSEAIQLAEEDSTCSNGTLTQNYLCNNVTGTWWIDVTMPNVQSGCNPACVINVNTKAVEVNYRCTGLLPIQNNTGVKGLSCYSSTGQSMEDGDALNIARASTCVNEGTLGTTFTCNANEGVWEINIIAPNLPNCNPVCKVSMTTRTASVDLRCV